MTCPASAGGPLWSGVRPPADGVFADVIPSERDMLEQALKRLGVGCVQNQAAGVSSAAHQSARQSAAMDTLLEGDPARLDGCQIALGLLHQASTAPPAGREQYGVVSRSSVRSRSR